MNKGKLFLLMFLFIVSIFSANAVTELTSCDVSQTFVSGETYIINISQVLSGYSDGACFRLDDTGVDNVTFIGTGEKIEVEKSGLSFFRISESNRWVKDYISFENINIEYTGTAKNTGEFLYLKGSENSNDGNSNLRNATFSNITVKNSNKFISFDSGQAVGGIMVSYSEFINNNIFTDSDILNDKACSSPGISQECSYYNNNHDSNVFVSRNGDYASPDLYEWNYKDNSYIDSVLKGNVVTRQHADTGEQNNFTDTVLVGEVNNDTNYYNYVSRDYSKDLFGYRWAGDIEDSESFVEGSHGEIVIGLSGDNYGSPFTISLQETLDLSIVVTNFTNFRGIDIVGGQVSCQYDGLCSMQSYFDSTISNKYRGLFSVQSDSLIDNIAFTKDGDNNAHVISNILDVTYNNIEVKDSIFNKITGTKINNDIASNDIIKVKGNDINIHDNIFDVINSNDTTSYQYLYIDSNDIASNNVYNNYFENTVSSQSELSEIFTLECDTSFYNNYVENGTIVSNSCNDIDPTPLRGFEHTDGKVYYYNLGNYYENNTACVDSDVDGFCDDSYTSGTVTDTNPLSEYPFDYTSHLLTADVVVDEDNFDILLTSPPDNYTFEFSDPSTASIDFGFIHDSSYPDLTCRYIIDGSTALNIGEVASDTEITRTFTGFSEKTYTYRVECSNDFITETSDEITFEVTQVEDGADDDTGTTPSEEGDSITPIFTSDTQNSSDGIIGMFALLNTPLQLMVYIALTLLAVSILALLFAVVGMFIR